jgi:two-component system KDP operon response regulator KdpE
MSRLPAALPAKILVVEDEPRLVRLMQVVLETARHEVLVASDGESAIAQTALEGPDLVLLDILLPGPLDGFAVCERIRQFSTTPIIMVTARAREEEKLRGFAVGADDYITKPFSAKELLARVHALLRRAQTPLDSVPSVRLGRLTVDPAALQVNGPDGPLHLTPTELRLILALARSPNRVQTHAALLSEVWGSEYRDETEYLRTYVRYLRKKLEPDPAHPRYLITVPGIGYRLDTD